MSNIKQSPLCQQITEGDFSLDTICPFMLRKFKNIFGNSWEKESRCAKNERWEATRGNFTYEVNVSFSSLNILLKEWLLVLKQS